VTLDDRCPAAGRRGWFAGIADVPGTAISMSVRQILAARSIVCVVPDLRKAEACAASIEGPLDPMVPRPYFARIVTSRCTWITRPSLLEDARE